MPSQISMSLSPIPRQEKRLSSINLLRFRCRKSAHCCFSRLDCSSTISLTARNGQIHSHRRFIIFDFTESLEGLSLPSRVIPVARDEELGLLVRAELKAAQRNVDRKRITEMRLSAFCSILPAMYAKACSPSWKGTHRQSSIVGPTGEMVR